MPEPGSQLGVNRGQPIHYAWVVLAVSFTSADISTVGHVSPGA
ncbi:MAG: hypothetical protein ACE5G5_12680 [Candidatus Methylomirabilales bacterium]